MGVFLLFLGITRANLYIWAGPGRGICHLITFNHSSNNHVSLQPTEEGGRSLSLQVAPLFC